MSSDAVAVSPSQGLDLVGHHVEAEPGLAGAGGLDGGVQRQQLGLRRDPGDQLHRAADLVGGLLKRADGDASAFGVVDRAHGELRQSVCGGAHLGGGGGDLFADGQHGRFELVGEREAGGGGVAEAPRAGVHPVHRGVDGGDAVGVRAGHAAGQEPAVEPSLGGGGQRRAGLTHEGVGHVHQAVDLPAGVGRLRGVAEVRYPRLEVTVGGPRRDLGQYGQRLLFPGYAGLVAAHELVPSLVSSHTNSS
nr:hypothetical protein GCM10020092_075590 [Actinoplanes digitatis]